MNKIFLVLALLPVLSFAQQRVGEGGNSEIKESENGIVCSSHTSKENVPTYFINGKELVHNPLPDLKPNDVKSITIIKTDTNYPNGKVEIVLKEK